MLLSLCPSVCALVIRNKNFPSQRVDEFNTIEYFPSVQSEKHKQTVKLLPLRMTPPFA
jgi:hypothetical protein